MKHRTYLLVVRNTVGTHDDDMQLRVADELLAISNNRAQGVAAGKGVLSMLCTADPEAITEVLSAHTRHAHWLVAPVESLYAARGLDPLCRLLAPTPGVPPPQG